MARMYSRAKGKSGSKRPITPKPTWVNFKQKEVEMLIVKLAKQGVSPSQIGLQLRDSYGIPSVNMIVGKKIKQILAEKNLAKKLPEDISSLIRRVIVIKKHMLKARKDEAAKHGLTLTESKIRKLVKYYKRIGVLPDTWHYDADRAELLLE